MSWDALALGTGLWLGLRHSLEPDHVAAVAQFASADPRPSRGLRFGLAWGAGHALAVLFLGALLIPLGARLGPRFEALAEAAVGLMLVGLGLWRLRDLLRVRHEHAHRHRDGVVHAHPHTHGIGHFHLHGPLLAGLVHGSAGALGVVALAAAAGSTSGALATIALFCLGSLLAMAAFGACAARVFALPGRWRRLLAAAAALSGVVLGAVWLGRSL
jgi:hypothetical protein